MTVATETGGNVMGGAINGEGSLTVAVEGTGKDSFLSQVIDLVKQAQESKSRTQDLPNNAAMWLTIVALGGGVLTFVIWKVLLGREFAFARKLGAIIFDKTGTLTEGRFGGTDTLLLGEDVRPLALGDVKHMPLIPEIGAHDEAQDRPRRSTTRTARWRHAGSALSSPRRSIQYTALPIGSVRRARSCWPSRSGGRRRAFHMNPPGQGTRAWPRLTTCIPNWGDGVFAQTTCSIRRTLMRCW